MIRFYRRLLLMFVGCLAFAGTVLAQNITLNSADGSVRLEGELLDFDGETYRIHTRFGELTVNAEGVICAGQDCPEAGQYAADIMLSGTQPVMRSLLPGLIEDFGFQTGQTTLRRKDGPLGWTYFIADAARVPVARVQGKAVGTADGFSELSAGVVDMAVAARAPTRAEIRVAKSTGSADLSSRFASQVLAIDGLIFVVSPRNPVSTLTREQITGIYAGKIVNWAELGGADGPIKLLSRNGAGDLARDFNAMFFAAGQGLKPAPSIALASDDEVSAVVMRDPFAIGYTGFSGVKNAKALAIGGACGISQNPTAFTLSAGDYPLSRVFYLYLPDRRLPIFARNFLAFLDSDAAQASIADLGFVGQGLYGLPLSGQQDRVANAIAFSGDEVTLAELQDFVGKFTGAKRLSATFRFNDGSTNIDARSRRNIRVLAEMIELGDFDGKKLIFAGFSDANGSAAGNRKISRQRAVAVAKLVKAAATRADLGRLEIQTLGMGEVSPLACNDTEQGRETNRRVEVWVK
ncbi:MAG: OmpA family protein [Alphaproteobacteria bacterium]|nr:OmpA family protein [Alphaproteobacteria bacterium]